MAAKRLFLPLPISDPFPEQENNQAEPVTNSYFDPSQNIILSDLKIIGLSPTETTKLVNSNLSLKRETKQNPPPPPNTQTKTEQQTQTNPNQTNTQEQYPLSQYNTSEHRPTPRALAMRAQEARRRERASMGEGVPPIPSIPETRVGECASVGKGESGVSGGKGDSGDSGGKGDSADSADSDLLNQERKKKFYPGYAVTLPSELDNSPSFSTPFFSNSSSSIKANSALALHLGVHAQVECPLGGRRLPVTEGLRAAAEGLPGARHHSDLGILLLREYHGWGLDSIAKLYGLTPPAIYQYYQNHARRLRDYSNIPEDSPYLFLQRLFGIPAFTGIFHPPPNSADFLKSDQARNLKKIKDRRHSKNYAAKKRGERLA